VLADYDRTTLNASNSILAANTSIDAANLTIQETNRMSRAYKDHLNQFNEICEQRLKSPEMNFN
jgi:hypothetical protein